MSEKKIRFLFDTFEFFGSVNPMTKLAKLLSTRGHEIIFVSNESFRKTIEDCGFIYEAKLEDNTESSSPQTLAESSLELLEDNTESSSPQTLAESSLKLTTDKCSVERLKKIIDGKVFQKILRQHYQRGKYVISKCIEKYKPDIIVTNSELGTPEAVYSGLPWVGVYCTNPLSIYNNDRLPPFMSGYATNGDPNDWIDFNILKKQHNDSLIDVINECHKEYGFPEVDTVFPTSPYLNIYNFPKELDYSDTVEIPKNWFRVDNFLYNQTGSEFVLPEQLKNKSGKLIYVSMGTIVSVNVDLMKRLVSALSKSPHRFIVSKGVRSSEYELCDNMWGESYVPQIAILQKVDLFITHGGNNSITEAFNFGKPMIVMPISYDQFDNAQRIHETGFGIRLNAQLFTENELLLAIETLLNDTELSIKLEKVAQRIQTDKSLLKAAQMIELLKEYYC